jgi:hypothetical protein
MDPWKLKFRPEQRLKTKIPRRGAKPKNPQVGLALGFGVLVLLIGSLRGRLLFQPLFEPANAFRQTLAQLRQLLWAKQDQSNKRY